MDNRSLALAIKLAKYLHDEATEDYRGNDPGVMARALLGQWKKEQPAFFAHVGLYGHDFKLD
jgi:hypothetical protein